MTKQHNFAPGHNATSGNDTSDATWRPFNVWRDQVKPTQRSASAPLLAATDATGSRDWDPYSVWKNQVKRR